MQLGTFGRPEGKKKQADRETYRERNNKPAKKKKKKDCNDTQTQKKILNLMVISQWPLSRMNLVIILHIDTVWASERTGQVSLLRRLITEKRLKRGSFSLTAPRYERERQFGTGLYSEVGTVVIQPVVFTLR